MLREKILRALRFFVVNSHQKVLDLVPTAPCWNAKFNNE